MTSVSQGLHPSWKSSRDRPKINSMEGQTESPANDSFTHPPHLPASTSSGPIGWDPSTHLGPAVPRWQGWSSWWEVGAGS